jgi:hypothetical protein
VIPLPAAITQEGIEITVADAVAVGFDVSEIDAEVGRAGADRGRGEGF